MIQNKRMFSSLEYQETVYIPKYKIPKDTRYNRDKAAKSVKGPNKKVLDEEDNLSYLIQLPKGKQCYHNTCKLQG